MQEPINRSPEGQLNGSDAAQSADTSSNKGGENVAALANNELGLNFLSESEVESKPESATEPLVPADSPAAPAPPEESGYRAPVSGDEGWVEQRGEGHLGNEAGGETGIDHADILNVYGLLTKREVKMAGYWLSSFSSRP